MGCVHSTESLATETEEESEPAPEPPTPIRKKARKSVKISEDSTEQKSTEQKPSDHSEGMKIRVIWRRVSIFGSRRDSSRSTGRRESSKSMEADVAEVAGPSNTLAPPGMSPKTMGANSMDREKT